EALDGLYQHDPRDTAETRALERVRDALASLARDCDEANPELGLPWTEVRAFLRAALAAPDPRQYLFTGGITFCGMVPLRVVPFRVICLLGMDETAFPRRESGGLDPLLADRRAGNPEKGDRDVRADDRLLFLQLLGAARDVFYVSWIGRDAHTNEVLAPSVVVAELMDVLREGYLAPPMDAAACDALDALLPQVQPLHPFAASLFDARAPRSYRREWLAAAATSGTQAVATPFVPDAPLPPAEPAQANALTLEELASFLLDPARGFLEHGLGLALPREEGGNANQEPLSPGDGLTRWRLTRALLDFDGCNASGDRDLLRARGQLPPGAFGDEALRGAHTYADALRSAVLAFTKGAAPLPAESLRVQWEDGTTLVGAPVETYPNGVLQVRPGVIDGRQVLRAWLDALACAAAGNANPVVLIGLDANEARSFALPRLPAHDARHQLRVLIGLYREGRRAPLPFFVRTSWVHALACAKAERKSGDAVGDVDLGVFERAAQAASSENGFGGRHELEDAPVCIAWRGRDIPGGADGELARSLHQTALTVFAQPARAWAEQFK
ncbi:MAG: hypothetical protein ACREP2_13415, partial [Rhodanobacteraceae bacterium]